MSRSVRFLLLAAFAIAVVVCFTAADGAAGPALTTQDPDAALHGRTLDLLRQGKKTFRFDTFGDEAFWGDTLRLHEAIEGEKHGGVGPGVSPKTALAVGLKVDVDALPGSLRSDLKHGRVDLDDPAVTLALSEAERGRRRDRLLPIATGSCSRSASSARSATRPWTTRSLRGSAIASTAGPTAI